MAGGALSDASRRFPSLFQVARADAHLGAGLSETSGESAALRPGAPYNGDNVLHECSTLDDTFGDEEETTVAAIPEKYMDLTEKKALAQLATLMPDGSPHVAPVWFEY